jgi:hypothetical protein
MKLNKNIPPPNGYIFRDVDGTTFKAVSLKALARKVLVYRTQTGGKTDNLEQEIENQICSTIPAHCHGDGSPRVEHRRIQVHRQTTKARAVGYLGSIARIPRPAKVNHQVTAERIRVCMACPKRLSIQESCGGCKKSTELLRSKCLGGAPVAPNLGVCDAYGIDLAVAVHLKEAPVDNPAAPGNCWRKMG